MKILYFGGQKSGKSSLAEKKALELFTLKPYYIATYNNSYNDSEMNLRVEKHRLSRKDDFITIEETHHLSPVIKPHNTYLIDCISMWLLNRLGDDEAALIEEIEKICAINATLIFVLNDVTCGVIPNDPISRHFVDLSGIIGQKLASLCDEVYEVKLGLGNRLK